MRAFVVAFVVVVFVVAVVVVVVFLVVVVVVVVSVVVVFVVVFAVVVVAVFVVVFSNAAMVCNFLPNPRSQTLFDQLDLVGNCVPWHQFLLDSISQRQK